MNNDVYCELLLIRCDHSLQNDNNECVRHLAQHHVMYHINSCKQRAAWKLVLVWAEELFPYSTQSKDLVDYLKIESLL